MFRISTVSSLESGQRSNHFEKRNCVHTCYIKLDETRDVLIPLSSTYIHTWEPEWCKRIIFNLDFEEILPFLIWMLSSTYHGPSLNRISCFCTFLSKFNNQRSRCRWDICHIPLVPLSQL